MASRKGPTGHGAAESDTTRRRWRFGVLPNEIAAPNEVR
jgi:hypothetical protein